MSNPIKKIRDNRDKMVIETRTGKRPKYRCKKCGRFTLYAFKKEDLDKGIKHGICVWCGK